MFTTACFVQATNPSMRFRKVVVVLDRLERLQTVAGSKLHEVVRRRVELVERQQLIRILVTLDLAPARRREDVVRELLRAVELAAIDRLDRGERIASELL
jgi:hypothetical protein